MFLCRLARARRTGAAGGSVICSSGNVCYALLLPKLYASSTRITRVLHRVFVFFIGACHSQIMQLVHHSSPAFCHGPQ